MTSSRAEIGAVPLDRDEARRAAEAVIETPGADAVEVLVSGSETGMTRYANSEIIQNTVRREAKVYVRVVVGDRVATASTSQFDADRMQAAAAKALEAARQSKPDPEFPGLPSPDRVGRAESVFRWDEKTAGRDPEARAARVRDVLKIVGDTSAAGIFETSAHAFGVFSSTGIDCFDAFTRSVVTCLVDTGDATGWGDASSHRYEDVDVEVAARRALSKAQRGPAVGDAEPGTYEVILEPAAVATMLDYLSYVGMGAKQMIEGESFLSTRAGERVGAPPVTVADDVWHAGSVGIGFDLEGVPKRRVAVIDEGVAKGPVTDLRTAMKLGAEVTGHYSGSTEYGPYASNVVMEAGDRSVDEMIASVDDGFLVTRFHYVNVLDRPTTLLTGMTRDGIFRITRGEIAEPVHNFRFAQSVLEMFAATKAVGRDLEAFAPDYGSFGSSVAPALHVGEFRFASNTSH